MRRGIISRRTLFGAVASLSVMGALPAVAQDPPTIGVVVKIGGIPWFNAMEAGIKEKSKELGVKAFMVGPTSADPALQVRAVEDLIAQRVNVIGVVPNDAQVLEPVLKRAMDAGIKVITHESPDQKNVDWNFELASAQGFGEAYGKLLAEKTGGKGKYAVFVGSLTVPLHNAWADAAIAYLKKNHPDMQLVGERYGVAEDVDASRRTALDVIRANPDLKAFLAFGSQGPIGAGRAVAERRKGGEILVLGPVLTRAGTQARPRRHPHGRFHVEPESGWRGLRDARHDAGQGRTHQGRHGDRWPRRDPPGCRQQGYHRRQACPNQ